ncbi:hypothetical protein OAA02_00070 [bacterium]|nr:hypothetical protein [bacterium]
MWKKIQERTLPFIIALSALSVSASAAFYSVSGLSKLFAGASLEVIIMASSLEVAKLVIASLLYQYRKTLPKGLKIYLTSAAVVLVLITSMGIYGFLSAAYQETASKAGNIEAQVTLLETKRDNFEERLAGYNQEKESLNQSISDLRAGLAGNKIQYKDRETGEIITTTSSSNRKAFERQLDQALDRQDVLNEKIDDVSQSIFNLETEIVEVKTNDELAGELGPLKYLSGLTGVSMDKIINILLLVIIFVFDPLAIALVIAANYAFERLKPQTRENIYGEKEVVEDDGMWTEEEMQNFNEQFNADDSLPDEEPEPDFKEDFEKDDWVVVDEKDFRDLDGDGIISEDEGSILKVLEETGRQYKVLYKDGSIRWVDKPDGKNRKVY